MRIISLFSFMLLALPAMAQDREGNNTPGEWRVDHFESFGLWDSACDWRDTDGVREERCYVRYVEVYSPRPQFGALFAFIVPDAAGYRLSLGVEDGTQFDEGGFRIEHGGAVVWTFSGDLCLFGGECVWTGGRDAEVFQALVPQEGTKAALVLAFADSYDQRFELRWDLSQMGEAFEDMDREAEKRGLR
ncbi:MAG: hypothetical protein AAF393_01295 [Pseudomonadota bacterium]